MILKKPGTNIETVVGDVFPNLGQIGTSLIFRQDSGLLIIENAHPSSSSYTRIATINPFDYQLLKQTSTTSYSSSWCFGWDHDNNKIIAAINTGNNIAIIDISDAGETATTLVTYTPGNYEDIMSIFRYNSEYHVLYYNGIYHRRALNGSSVAAFSSPFGVFTSVVSSS